MTPPARLLDVTRTLRRAGRLATGVDRVERAYIRAFVNDPVPAFGIARTKLGYVLLNDAGLSRFLDGLTPGLSEDAALAHLRAHAVGRTWPPGLGRLLKRYVPQGSAYFNVGHSNITPRVFSHVRRALGGRVVVLVHDIIPLQAPQWQRPGTVEPFEEKMRLVGGQADVVIANSQDTADHLTETLRGWGRVPEVVVAHLGVDLTDAAPQEVPAQVRTDRPYFVTLGTIEPRKNHAFILDLWEELGPDAPGLLICGQRGWNNQAVFDRLDALPVDSPIQEVTGASDGAISSLLEGSCGLLCPTHLEGFGLPAAEAAALGVPVLANDLNIFREVCGNIAIYASVSDRYLWIKHINDLRHIGRRAVNDQSFTPPAWDDHFKTVLSLG